MLFLLIFESINSKFMKHVYTIGVLIISVFLLQSSYAIEFNSVKNQNPQLIQDDIIVLYENTKRKIPIDYKNKTINIFEGAKVIFKSKNTKNYKYSWSFGDEKLKEGGIINYQFNTIGKYNVTLKVEGNNNIKISKLKVAVKAYPIATRKNALPPEIIKINDAGDAESKYSLEQLVEEVLIKGGCSTVDNFTVQVKGNPEDNTTKNYGYFNRGTSTDFPFEDGIVITTGIAFEAGNTYVAPDPNDIFGYPTTDNGLGNDPDVETALGITPTKDASFVKFNFTPLTEEISFRFIMASEEYPDFECDYSDGFAFLLREVGTANYTNIAVLPDGTTAVSITNINNSNTCSANPDFFEGYQIGHTNYNGRTKVLTATSAVTPGTTYEIKLVVADAKDSILDSAIFLEGGSFNLGGGLGDDITISAGTASCVGTSVEIQTESPDATHTWSLNGVEIQGAGTGHILTVTEPGTYSVEIDFGGTNCISSDSVIVEFIANDDATFTMAPSCIGSVATVTGTPGGVFSFNPVPTDGAVIDAATGEVSNGVPGSIYNVEYTTQGSCPDNLIVPVEILASEDATFTMTPNCDTTATATVTGAPGGVFSFNPVPTDGAVIDATTGEISNGVSGAIYNVQYVTQGTCAGSSSVSVEILTLDDATFTMTPSCIGATVTVTGTPGGVFSFNPVPTDGAIINATTGEISSGVSGATYNVEYITSGLCSDSLIISVELLTSEDPTFTMTPSCIGATVTVTGTPGGVFSFNPVPTDGAVIDATTGEITNGTPGTTYNVEYITPGICSENLIVPVEILASEDAAFTIVPSCTGAIATIEGTLGGVFNFNPVPTDGATINATTGEINNGTQGTTYNVEYTTPGTCSDNLIVPVEILESEDASFTMTPDCGGTATATVTGSSGGEFSFDPMPTDGAVIDSITGVVTNGTGGNTYTVVYTINNGCYAAHTENLTILPEPTIVIPEPFVNCDDNVELDNDASNDTTLFNLIDQDLIILNGQSSALHTVSYHLSQADAESGENPLVSPYENNINPQTIYIRIEKNDSLCYNTGEMTIQVNPLPKIELDDRYGICVDNEGNVILPTSIIDTGLDNANYSFEWYINNELVIGETNSSISITEEGDYNVIVTNTTTGCTASKDTIVIQSVPPAVEAEQASITFLEANVIYATASTSGLYNGLYEFKLDDGPWVSNMPNNNTYTFENVPAGTHIVTARDIAGCGESSTTIILLEFIPYFTPNGDGYHDTWNIIGLENQADAKLHVFDRYGKLLKELSVSGKGWDGTYNNNLMPSSDYWFTLQYRNPNTNVPDVFKSHFTLKR